MFLITTTIAAGVFAGAVNDVSGYAALLRGLKQVQSSSSSSSSDDDAASLIAAQRCIHAPIRRIGNRLALTSCSAPGHQSPAVTTVLSLERPTYAHRDAATRGRNLSDPTEGIARDIQQRIHAAKCSQNLCGHFYLGRTCFKYSI